MKIYFKFPKSTEVEFIEIHDNNTTIGNARALFNAKIIKDYGLEAEEVIRYIIFAGKALQDDDSIPKDAYNDPHDPLFIVTSVELGSKKSDLDLDNELSFKKRLNSFSNNAQDLEKIAHKDVDTLFKQMVNNFGDKSAVHYRGQDLNYAELNHKVNQLAAHLIFNPNFSLTDKPCIALIGDHKLNLLIGQLAALRLGVTYIPLDIYNPRERLKHQIAYASNPIILFDNDLKTYSEEIEIKFKELFFQLKVINAGNIDEILKSAEGIDLEDDVEAFISDTYNPAYIIYTSGSTSGNPKGIMQSQHGLIEQIKNYTRDLELSEVDNILNLAAFTHDQAIVDVYAAMLNGATLHLYDINRSMSIDDLRQFISQQKITIFSSIPSIYEFIFSNLPPQYAYPNLRVITTGGEETMLSHAKLYQQLCTKHRLANCVFINGYGASECSWISSYKIHPNTDLSQMKDVPLGQVTQDIEYIIDNSEGTYPEGQGELCVISHAVALGYIGDDANSTSFSRSGDDRMIYRTGDIVDSNGDDLQFIGRAKWHAKLNGQRINLREIELAIADITSCPQVAVFVAGENPNKKIIACVETTAWDDDKESHLRQELTYRLPDYMLPSRYHIDANLKKLNNQKLDRQFLQKLFENNTQTDLSSLPKVNNIDDFTVAIKQTWESALKCSINDESDFIALGGTSLDAFSVITKTNALLYELYNIDFNLKTSFLYKNQRFNDFKSKLLQYYITKKQDIDDVLDVDYPKARLTQVSYLDLRQWAYMLASAHNSIKMNFEGFCCIAEYYNRKYGITILPCASHEAVVEVITEYIQNTGLPNQIGLTIPRNNGYKNSHPTPTILHIDRENNEVFLFVSDSMGMEGFSKKECDFILNKVAGLHILFDQFPARQDEEYSCSLDALIYLKDALRIENFKTKVKHSIIHLEVNNPQIMGFYSPEETLKGMQQEYAAFANPEEYEQESNNSSKKIDNAKRFFNHVDLNEPLSTSKKQKTLGEIYAQNFKMCWFVPANTLDNISLHRKQDREIKLNTHYHSKTEKYMNIIRSSGQTTTEDEKMEENNAHLLQTHFKK